MEFLTILAKTAGIFALVCLNGFFVAAEFAIVKVRSTQIESLLKTGGKKAAVARHVVTHLDRYLSATQLGITVTSLALGWLGEPFVAEVLKPCFIAAGVYQEALQETLSIIVGFCVITFLATVLGELTPKWLAIQRAQQTALALARPLHLFYLFFRPFIWLLNRAAGFVLGLIGMTPPGEGDLTHSEEELRLLLANEKVFSATGKNILLNAIDLKNRTVREVMVPRTGVVFLSSTKSIDENISIALENQFTRYPLCERNLDNILGMIHLKDLIRLQGKQGAETAADGAKLLEIKREILFVPETMSLERILNTFLARRLLMAIVVDEYGGTAGLITLENVLEELVGDIRDEFDVEPLMVQKVSDAEFLVAGSMPLHDFSRMFDVVPATRDVVTVSGYALQILGRVPEKGARMQLGRWSGTVEAIDGKTVKTLRLRRSAGPEGEG